MYTMSWEVEFTTSDHKKYRLQTLASAEIEKAVDKLSDTAIIRLPASVLNSPLSLTGKIGRGDAVTVKLGYNGVLREEFAGYITALSDNGGSLQIECQDSLFLFRKGVPDIAFKEVILSALASYLCNQIGGGFRVQTEYDISWESFVIKSSTAYDVLKKIQAETSADIYFKNKELHIHPPYLKRSGTAVYDFYRNVIGSNLEYKTEEQTPVRLTIEKQGRDGKIEKVTVGRDGGESITRKVGSIGGSSLQKIAQDSLKRYSYTGYRGSIETWLLPVVEPSYAAKLTDRDQEYKNGIYYVTAVTTSFSEKGATRTVKLGIKLS